MAFDILIPESELLLAQFVGSTAPNDNAPELTPEQRLTRSQLAGSLAGSRDAPLALRIVWDIEPRELLPGERLLRGEVYTFNMAARNRAVAKRAVDACADLTAEDYAGWERRDLVLLMGQCHRFTSHEEPATTAILNTILPIMNPGDA